MTLESLQQKASQLSSDGSEGENTQAEAATEGGEGQKSPTEGQTEVQKYEANLAYEVYGKKKEFDARVKEWIKSKEDEDFIRDLYTKADGIEGLKTQRDQYRNQFNELSSEVNAVLDAASKGDLKAVLTSVGWDVSNIGNVLHGLGVSKDDIIKYAYQLAQLTPEQETLQNQLRQEELKRKQLEQQNQQLTQQDLQSKLQQRQVEVTQLISTPEILPIAQQIDALRGEGTFFREVWERGKALYFDTGKDLPATEVVKMVADAYKPFIQSATAQTQTQPSQSTVETPSTQQKKPTLPNIGNGSSQTPAGRGVKSIKDIEKLYAEKFGSN